MPRFSCCLGRVSGVSVMLPFLLFVSVLVMNSIIFLGVVWVVPVWLFSGPMMVFFISARLVWVDSPR